MARPSQKDAILDAALACFAEVGFAGTKIRSIAERAGVSQGALYRHFASKEELARALYADGMGWIAEALAHVVDGGGTATERLRAATVGAFGLYREHPSSFRFVLTWAPDFCSPGDVEPPLAILVRLVSDGQTRGEFVEGDATMLACLVMGCIVEPIVLATNAPGLVPDVLSDDSHDSAIADFVVAALARHGR